MQEGSKQPLCIKIMILALCKAAHDPFFKFAKPVYKDHPMGNGHSCLCGKVFFIDGCNYMQTAQMGI